MKIADFVCSAVVIIIITSDCLVSEAQGGHGRKQSISGLQILRRLPSISNDYQSLPVEVNLKNIVI